MDPVRPFSLFFFLSLLLQSSVGANSAVYILIAPISMDLILPTS